VKHIKKFLSATEVRTTTLYLGDRVLPLLVNRKISSRLQDIEVLL
jgi:hypothetical protein